MRRSRAAGECAPRSWSSAGRSCFALFLPRATRIHLTRVHGRCRRGRDVAGARQATWEAVARERHEADERHAYAMTFEVWEKRR